MSAVRQGFVSPRLTKVSSGKSSTESDDHQSFPKTQSRLRPLSSLEALEWETLGKPQSTEVLRKKIKGYNKAKKDTIEHITIKDEAPDGSLVYEGILRLYWGVTRSMHVVGNNKKVTSLIPPYASPTAIRISSKMSTLEVVMKLLQKYQFVDDPTRFVLKEIREKDNWVAGTLGPEDLPLPAVVGWGKNKEGLKVFLCDDVNYREIKEPVWKDEPRWEDFTQPELEGLLNALQVEERRSIERLHERYAVDKTAIQRALKDLEL